MTDLSRIDAHSGGQCSPDPWIAALATRQHGVVARRQLLAEGMGPRAIDHRVQRGRLHVVHRGVYVVGHTAVRREAWWMAAVLACGEDAVLSHLDAGALWDVRRRESGAVHVTAAHGARKRPGIVVHRPRVLDAGDVATHRGIPVTTVARTIVDLAAVLPRQRLARMLHEAEIRQLLDARAIREAMARHHKRKGLPTLDALLIDHTRIAPTRSELEDLFLDLCDKAKLPRPQTNAQVEGFTVDAVWHAQRLVVELDGGVHATKRLFESDRVRDATLQIAGYRVVRFTWRRVVDEPLAVAAVVRTLLDQYN